MVTHATSYDVLVGGVVLYPIGVTIEFWDETSYYHPNWQTRVSHKASLPLTLIRGQARKSNKSIMLARFSGLPHGLELLEGKVHDQDAPPNGELAV